MRRRRLGIALVVPEPLASAIEGLRLAFGDPARGRIPPHITLVPPVNVAQDAFDPALDALRAAAAMHAPLVLTLGPVATFSPGRRVAYLEVGGVSLPDLGALRAAVHTEPLYKEEQRAFVPHVTVCADAEPAQIAAMVESARQVIGEARFETVHVLENFADDDGVFRWHVIEGAPLAAPATIGRGGLELTITAVELDGVVTLTARRTVDAVGRAVMWLPGARLLTIEVAEASRAMGIAAHLLAAAEHEARRRGVGALVADAHPFLTRHGWVTTPDGARRILTE